MDLSTILVSSIGALIIFFLGFVIERTVNNILKRALKSFELNRIAKKTLKIKFNLENTLIFTVKTIIFLLTTILILKEFNINTSTITQIFLILIGVSIIFIVLAFKDFIPNLFSGIMLKKSKQIKIGDHIEIRGIEGEIIEMGLIETKIKTKNKETIFVPNTMLK